MDKQAIKHNLLENHTSFIYYLDSLTKEEYTTSKNEKWTPGQQLEHIVLGIKPFNQILNLPKLLLKIMWGQANRKSSSYDELVKKYLLKLENGGRATGRFVPKRVSFEKGLQLKVDLKNEVAKLSNKLDELTEDELDKYLLPHPLLGKLTIREMLFFTIYHVRHHEELTKNLQK